MDPKKTGEYILEKRKEKKITQQELADLLNVTNKAVSRWERGDGYPDISLLPSLATILGCSVDEILNGEDIKNNVINKKRNTQLFTYVLSFSIINVFAYILGIIVAYATLIEAIGAVLICISVVATVIPYIFLRRRYIDECDYTDSDKWYIFKNTTIMTSIISFIFCMYSPLIISDFENGINCIITYEEYCNMLFALVLLGGLVAFLINIINYLINYNRKSALEILKIVGLTLLSFVVIFFYSLIVREPLGLFIIAILFIILSVVIAVLRCKKKISNEVLVLVIAYTLNLVLNYCYEQFGIFLLEIGEYAYVSPSMITVTCFLVLIGPLIYSIRRYRHLENKILNRRIIFIIVTYFVLFNIALFLTQYNIPHMIH